MPQRRFLIASSFARLIRRDQDMVGRIVEGYFPARPERDHFISIEPGHCFLVLAPTSETAGVEERAEIPRSQADALLPVCAGKVGFECTIVRLQGGTEAVLQRFVVPGSLDLLSVEFEDDADANGFAAPAWVGPEVTQDPAYDRGAMARFGMPEPEAIPLADAMLDELLDTLEESRLAAQLGGSQVARKDLSRSQDDGRGASPEAPPQADQRPGSPDEEARRTSLMAGLAQALNEEGRSDNLTVGLAEALKNPELPEAAPGTGAPLVAISRPISRVRALGRR
jgi:CYTH domain-containing protein